MALTLEHVFTRIWHHNILVSNRYWHQCQPHDRWKPYPDSNTPRSTRTKLCNCQLLDVRRSAVACRFSHSLTNPQRPIWRGELHGMGLCIRQRDTIHPSAKYHFSLHYIIFSTVFFVISITVRFSCLHKNTSLTSSIVAPLYHGGPS